MKTMTCSKPTSLAGVKPTEENFCPHCRTPIRSD